MKERIAAYREAGVSVLNVTPIGPDPLATIEQLKEWCHVDEPPHRARHPALGHGGRDHDHGWNTAPCPRPEPEKRWSRVRFLSMDPTIRTWMDDAPGYLPPIGLGEIVRGAGVGEVVAVHGDRYAVGDLVVGLTGWQDYAIADEGPASMQVIPPGIDPPMVAQRPRGHRDDGVLRAASTWAG